MAGNRRSERKRARGEKGQVRSRSPRQLTALSRRRIPFALAGNRHPVVPSSATTDQVYLCPECLAPVQIDRSGDENVFVHRDQAPECSLEGPGWIRLAAAHQVYVCLKLRLDNKGPATSSSASAPTAASWAASPFLPT